MASLFRSATRDAPINLPRVSGKSKVSVSRFRFQRIFQPLQPALVQRQHHQRFEDRCPPGCAELS
jgi:hypothetical protein